MQYIINPFTGALDAVGGSGGASAPIAAQYLVLAPHAVLTDERVFTDGVGLLGTDAGAGSTYTLDLNINELTSETTPTASDLFPFLDVDVSTSPTGARKVTLANLATAISTSLGGPFQPLDAGLTALASLGAGIAVSDGADGWFARSIAVTDTVTIDLTVTNASGVAGNPTISGSVIPGGIDHGALADLLADDHTQYTLRAGRATTTNDTTLTTTAAGTGSLYGGSAADASLGLNASSSGSAHTGRIRLVDRTLAYTGLTSVSETIQAILWQISATYDNAAASVAFTLVTGQLEQAVTNASGDIVVYNNKLQQVVNDPAVLNVTGVTGMSNQPSIQVNNGCAITAGSGGFSHAPNFATAGTGTITGAGGAGADVGGFAVSPGFSGNISAIYYEGLGIRAPGGTTGSAAVGDFVGIDIASFGVGAGGGGLDFSLRSAGGHMMLHNGNVMIGSSTLIPGLDLDINGDFGTRSRNVTLANGANNDVGSGAFAVTRISGPTAAFSVTGMNNPILGRHVWLVNTTSQAMSVTNNDGGSTAGQRILTPGGGTVTRSGPSIWKFWYDSTTAAWRLHADEFTSATAAHNFLDSTVHNNTATGTPTRGDLIVANSTPAWATFGLGGTPADKVLTVNGAGTDPAWAKLVRNNTGANTGTTDTFVFQTAPTLVTSVTVPLVIGGTGATDDLTIRSSSGAGGTSNDIIFQVGNNGATEAMRILGSGLVGFATASPAFTVDINGTFALRRVDIALANAANSDVDVTGKTFVRFTGGGASCTLTGITGGGDGRFVWLFNDTGSAISLVNDATSTAANRLLVAGGTRSLADQRTALFGYDSSASRWQDLRFT